jgi:hypothetical protein
MSRLDAAFAGFVSRALPSGRRRIQNIGRTIRTDYYGIRSKRENVMRVKTLCLD